ncbi:MAG TPA: tetratricopeptide repeat protein, partial [Herpetosiphonaceae bacterium]
MSIDQPADINAIDDPAALLAEGRAAMERDDKQTARAALRRAVKLAPESAEAWLALAGVVGTMSERRQAYERALALDPASQAAKDGLAALN